MKKWLWFMAGFGAIVVVSVAVLYLGSGGSEFVTLQTTRVGKGEVVVVGEGGFDGDCDYGIGVRPSRAVPFQFLWTSREMNDTPTIAVGGNEEFIAVQVTREDSAKNQKIGDFWCAWYDVASGRSARASKTGLRPFSTATHNRLRRFGGAETRELQVHKLGRWMWQDRDYKNFIDLVYQMRQQEQYSQ